MIIWQWVPEWPNGGRNGRIVAEIAEIAGMAEMAEMAEGFLFFSACHQPKSTYYCSNILGLILQIFRQMYDQFLVTYMPMPCP